MTRTTLTASRRFAVIAACFLVLAGVLTGIAVHAPRAEAATPRTPVMGPNILNADELARWYASRRANAAPARIPALNNSVRALAQIFLDEGRREGVRGDIAFVQSVIETGWFVFPDNGQIRPSFNNFAGINAYGGRRVGTTCAAELVYEPNLPSRCFATPQLGVRAQIHLLRGYADPLSRDLPDRLRMPPSDRIGIAPWWEYFGNNNPTGKLIWAASPNYGITILKLFSGALMFNGKPALGGYPDVTAPVGVIQAPSASSTQSSATFVVEWWAQDFESGVVAFNVDVMDNGGPWVRWMFRKPPRSVTAPAATGEFTFFGVKGHTYAFRVQPVDKAGNFGQYSPTRSTTVSASAPRPMPFGAAYAVGIRGELSALSSVPIGGPQFSTSALRGFALRTQGGGYDLDYSGGIWSVGNAPKLANSGYFRGRDVMRGLALNPDGHSGYALDGAGGLWPAGNAVHVYAGAYWRGRDIARDIVLLPTSTATRPAGYVMDAFGGLHAFGAAPPVHGGPYWSGWAIARDVVLNPNGPGGWILDGWGGLNPFGGAPRVTISHWWRGQDLARGAVMFNGPHGLTGYVLDAWGGVHPVNGAPLLNGTRYWPHTNTARYLALTP